MQLGRVPSMGCLREGKGGRRGNVHVQIIRNGPFVLYSDLCILTFPLVLPSIGPPLSDVSVQLGHELSLECMTTGIPPPEITWSR